METPPGRGVCRLTAALLLGMAVSLSLTIALELLFALAAGFLDSRTRTGRALMMNCLANIMTNPLVCSLYYFFRYGLRVSGVGICLVTAVLEISAVLTEWRVYKSSTDIKRPLLFSLTANCFSYFTGFIMNNL